ncbi:unnamed protein product [Clonostachys byssicola]|uniref:protein-tyrosine-phosphatase n=1 Tax=Clonostachys byssicola TaxID=160290 RepID=A0A9N9UTD9_9HYPO|nr:unnamed protein product [Clonostachys byssicola]
MHDAKPGERTPLNYTMKTAAPKTPGSFSHHSHNYSSHGLRHPKPSNKPASPLSSPRAPYSTGQNYAPKLSPGRPVEMRSSSPNYFGLVVDSSNDPRDSSGLGRNNWSPPSSSVKSFAAAIPAQLPLDANPEFEAFKRQADLNRGMSLSISSATFGLPTVRNAPTRPPPPPRWHTHASDADSERAFPRFANSAKDRQPSFKMDIDQDSLHDSAYVSSDSKRNSESSLFPLQLGGVTRYESPRPIEGTQQRTGLTKAEDRDPRLSVMEHKLEPPLPSPGEVNRAATMPIKMDVTQSMISGQQLKDMMSDTNQGRLLILDIRSSQNYAQSHIQGALNLCIPTTLLKRATFNTQRLQQTFSSETDADKFSTWREMETIVVYDAYASDKRDAVAPQNMIKKFTNEGFSGETFILRGGFTAFQENYPTLLEQRSSCESACGASNKGLAPVIGGVSLPTCGNEPNPFFSNIRQNMDLADGVGQFELSRPEALDSPLLPKWLREAAEEPNKGKKVADKFLHIEKDEMSRMKSAYAAFNPKHNVQGAVQLIGVEQGGKNRYKDILPFEHARVKLHCKPDGSCDYVNASHIQSSMSNKRYIASQGPLPTTFEDFWSVVWEQDVRVIVMLTAESEGGQLKCHSYWKEKDYGQLKLKPLSEKKASLDIDKHRGDSIVSPSPTAMGEIPRRRANTMAAVETPAPSSRPVTTQAETPYVVIRKFALSHAAHPFEPMREITQLHFSSWPDFGAPAQPSHLLALVELANIMQRAALPVETPSVVGGRASINHTQTPWHDEPESDKRVRPMLVHCSAGCGRTGTFCAVDSVIDMLKRQRRARSANYQAKSDEEGDIQMDEAHDIISPKTNRKMSFSNASIQKSINERGARPAEALRNASWVADDTVDLIETTVEDFRRQRLSMVQSLRQFVLCYETVLEWVHRVHGSRPSTGPLGGARARSGSLQQAIRDRA